jgi:hypothetical protein
MLEQRSRPCNRLYKAYTLKHGWELRGLMVKLGKLTLNHVLDEHASFGNLLVDLEFLVVGS